MAPSSGRGRAGGASNDALPSEGAPARERGGEGGEGAGDEALSQVVFDESLAGWVEVGRREELAGDRRLRVLAGSHDVALFELDGRIRAIDNRCPHAGGPLSEGLVCGDVVVCPLHAWRFHLGTGASPDHPGVSVRVYDVRLEGDRILVRF